MKYSVMREYVLPALAFFIVTVICVVFGQRDLAVISGVLGAATIEPWVSSLIGDIELR